MTAARTALPVLALATLAIVDALTNPAPQPVAVVATTGVLSALVLLWRRRAPIAAPLVLAALVTARGLAGAVPDQTTSTLPMLIVAVFSAAAYAPRLRTGVLSGAACLGGTITAIGLAVEEPLQPLDLIVVSVLILAAAGAGALLRERTARTRAEGERTAAADAARTTASTEAVAEERARIARELHDVLAHSTSIIAVQAGAAERQAHRDVERARAAVAEVRRVADETKDDLARLLLVLHGAPDVAAAAPPGLAELRALVAETRDAGLPVELHLDAALDAGLPDGVALAAYRIVQESLTNVRKHAGTVPTDVRVRRAGSGLRVEVVNVPGSGPGDGSGLGLVGMDERVRVHGGDLRVGPDAAGRWSVDALLPIGEAP